MPDRLISTSYYGGKNRATLQDTILKYLELNEGFCEPFCGSAGVMLNRARVSAEILNDVDDLIVNFFRVLRDRPDDLIRALSLTPYARAERDQCLQALADPDALDAFERARCWYVGVAMGARAVLNSGFGFGNRKKRNLNSMTYRNRVIHGLHAVADRLLGVTIENADAIAVMEKIVDSDGWTVYCDPPYPASTRSAHGLSYRHDTTGDLHQRLLDVCMAAKSQIVISTYDSDLYRSTLKGWHRIEIEVHRVSSITAMADGAIAKEVIYANRLPACSLFE